MGNKICGVLEPRWLRGPCLTVRIFMAVALGIVFFGEQAILKAQDTAQAPKPGPPVISTAAPSVPPSSAPPPVEYLINPGDVVDVYVYDVPELSHTYTVSPSGVINVPLLPQPLHAAGLTPEQLARALEDAFRQSGRLQRPEIAVSLKPSLASSVAVEGALKNPQMVPGMGRTRLVDIFTQCGGLSDDAGDTVTITRGPLALMALAREGGQTTPTLTVELKKVMDINDPLSAISVWPGDRVMVDRQKPDVYYVLGEVKSPGGYTIKNGRDELTVLRAVALAGDVTPTAKAGKAFIIRKDLTAPKGREEIQLNLQKILRGRAPDVKVQAEDILFVPGSTGKKALHTLEAAPGMIATDAAVTILLH